MSIYYKLYDSLCQRGKLRCEDYGYKSGLHAHHIIPRHSNGSDDASNLTYLTPREHIAAHFLLWKLYENVNDLRSMNMLGAKLTIEQRRKVGIWCRDNNIGIFGASKEDRKKWRRRGFDSQRDSGSKNTFYYWSTEEGRKERASRGGKKLASPEFNYWFSPDGHHRRAKMGAAKSAKKPATNGIITKKFHTDIERDRFLVENPEWRSGHHWSKSTHHASAS